MGGKASLLLVIGFSMLFMIFSRNFNNMGYDTLDNYSRYFYKAKAHSLALTGINIMSNQIWLNLPDFPQQVYPASQIHHR